MIYFRNYNGGNAGLNNHVIPYTFCISLSNFLDRDFYFAEEQPCTTPPEFAVSGAMKEKFEILIKSSRSKVSDLVKISNRRTFEYEPKPKNRLLIDDPMGVFVTDDRFSQLHGTSPVKDFFGLGRELMTREQLQSYDEVEIGPRSLVNATYFYFLERSAKNELLSSIAINYLQEIEDLAAAITREIGSYNSVHLRQGDFIDFYAHDGYKVDVAAFARSVESIFGDDGLPVYVATDSLEDKEMFVRIFGERPIVFIDELIFSNFELAFKNLPFTDFNALSVLNQIICSNAESFIGTCRSTFTSVIHRLRQERFGKADFNFFPDRRTERVMNSELVMVPDQHGFFDWNRYSAFSENAYYPCWMREWNYDLTSII